MATKNLRPVGMIIGLIGGGVCILGGLLSFLLGLAATSSMGSTIPPGLYFSLGLYFLGKGAAACGLSLTTGWSEPGN